MFKSIEFAIASKSTIEQVKKINPQYGVSHQKGGVAIHRTDTGHIVMVDKEWKILPALVLTGLAVLVFPVVYFFKK